MIFQLRCPACKQKMKYGTDTRILTKKRKRCVYCGRSFSVRNNLIKEIKD
ncbi:hypothetical protein ACFLZ7_00145 [Nanoarchaeota archaeon]